MYFFRLQNLILGVLVTLIVLAITLPIIDRTLFSGTSGAAGSPPAASQQQTSASRSDDAIEAEYREARQLLDEAERSLAETLKHVDEWDRDIVPLQDGPAGLTIAEDETLSGLMAYVFEDAGTRVGQMPALQNRLRTIRDEVDAAAATSPPTGLSSGQMVEVRELHASTNQIRKDWEQAIDDAHAIKRKAGRLAEPAEEQQATLKLSDSMEQAQDEEALAALTKKRELEKEKEAEAVRKAEEQAQLEEEAQSPEVLAALATFVTPRYVQPELAGTSSIKWKRTATQQPMSLTAIGSTGALRPSTQGLRMLAEVGANRKLDSPRWGYPSQPSNWTDDQQADLQNAQDLLLKYGPTLVRLGKLSP